jgi:spermidine/putrescine transport system permease protein
MLKRAGGTLVVVPAVAWLAIFFLVPLALIAVVSLGDRDEVGRIVLYRLSLDNYVKALDPAYLPTLLTALRYAAVSALASILIGYPIAYWISRYGGKRKVLLLLLVLLPFWTSWLIRTYAWMIILRDNGVVNSFLQAVGLTSEPVILLNTDFAVILGMTYGFLPFAILPIYVAIDRLDPNLVGAARDLYASGRSAFFHVTLPLSMPGVIAAAILTFIPAMGDFVTPELLGGAQQTTIAKIIQERFLEGRDWAFGSALGFVLIAVTLVGTVIALRNVRREIGGAE